MFHDVRMKDKGDVPAAAGHIPLFSCNDFKFMRIIIVVVVSIFR